MRDIYLQVTFRRGKPLAAYLCLPREAGDRSVRVEKRAPGLLVDFSADGRPIGIEIAIPSLVTVEAVNEVLASHGFRALAAEELSPLRAA